MQSADNSCPVTRFVSSTGSLAGALVLALVDGDRERGAHEVVWRGVDAANIPLASGLYIYQLDTGQQRLTRKMLLVR